MTMPGFTAEMSLNKTSRYYHTIATGIADAAQVVPQARVASCILTIDGGLWCCVQGPKAPICWKVPPPPIIWV
jgi:hypothetical protein